MTILGSDWEYKRLNPSWVALKSVSSDSFKFISCAPPELVLNQLQNQVEFKMQWNKISNENKTAFNGRNLFVKFTIFQSKYIIFMRTKCFFFRIKCSFALHHMKLMLNIPINKTVSLKYEWQNLLHIEWKRYEGIAWKFQLQFTEFRQ